MLIHRGTPQPAMPSGRTGWQPPTGSGFKYDDANPVENCERVIGRLEQRGHGLDAGPRPSRGGAWPRSVTGRRAGSNRDLTRCGAAWRVGSPITLSE
jgi:hypothetical protein